MKAQLRGSKWWEKGLAGMGMALLLTTGVAFAEEAAQPHSQKTVQEPQHPSSAGEEKIFTIGTDQGLSSKYLWRGTTMGQLNDGTTGRITDFHKTAWQGDVYLNLYGWLNFNVWYDMPLGKTAKDMYQNPNVNGKFFEVDYNVNLNHTFGDFNVTLGHLTMTYPKQIASPNAGSTATATAPYTASALFKNTSEIFASVGYNTLLSPTLTVNYDYDKVKGFYFQFDVSHSIEVSDWALLKMGGTVGYAVNEGPDTKATAAKNYFYYDKNSGITHGHLWAAMDFKLGHCSDLLEHFTLTPSYMYEERSKGMILGNKAGATGIAYTRQDSVLGLNLKLEF